MKKNRLLLILSLLLCVQRSFAGDGDKYINVSGGWQYKNTVNALISVEFEGINHSSYEFYLDLANVYREAPDGKVHSNTFWDYKSLGIGTAWKPVISRGRNTALKWRLGADIGANDNSFQASLEVGLEYSYTLKNGWKLFALQKNELVFWTRDHFRNGLLIGVKLPF